MDIINKNNRGRKINDAIRSNRGRGKWEDIRRFG